MGNDLLCHIYLKYITTASYLQECAMRSKVGWCLKTYAGDEVVWIGTHIKGGFISMPWLQQVVYLHGYSNYVTTQYLVTPRYCCSMLEIVWVTFDKRLVSLTKFGGYFAIVFVYISVQWWIISLWSAPSGDWRVTTFSLLQSVLDGWVMAELWLLLWMAKEVSEIRGMDSLRYGISSEMYMTTNENYLPHIHKSIFQYRTI